MGSTVSGTPADVEHDHGPQIGFFFELLDVQPVVSAQNLPIHVPQFVPRLIHPVFRKLHREASAGRPMQPGQKPFDYPLGDHLQPTELGDLEWIEEVEAGWGRR